MTIFIETNCQSVRAITVIKKILTTSLYESFSLVVPNLFKNAMLSTFSQVLESPELKIVRESLIQLLVLRPIAEFSPPLSPDQVKHFAQIMKIVSSYPLGLSVSYVYSYTSVIELSVPTFIILATLP